MLRFLVLLVLLCAVLLVVGIIPTKVLTDYDSPLNLFMFQEPGTVYSDQIVNVWVPKPWRSDGQRIPCVLEEATPNNPPRSERTLILYSHGNNENLLHTMQFLREVSSTLEVDALAWDYSGYGLNPRDKFERTAQGINLSLQTLVEYATKELGYDLKRILFWGYSLGSGPTLHTVDYLCNRGTPPLGVILFAAYASIRKVVADITSDNVSNLFAERWNNALRISGVKCPILIMHGQNDHFIRSHHAQSLKQQATHAKLVLLPNTGHTTFAWGEALREVRAWLASAVVNPPTAATPVSVGADPDWSKPWSTDTQSTTPKKGVSRNRHRGKGLNRAL